MIDRQRIADVLTDYRDGLLDSLEDAVDAIVDTDQPLAELAVTAERYVPSLIQVMAEMDDGTARLFEGPLDGGVALPGNVRKVLSYGLSSQPASETIVTHRIG